MIPRSAHDFEPPVASGIVGALGRETTKTNKTNKTTKTTKTTRSFLTRSPRVLTLPEGHT